VKLLEHPPKVMLQSKTALKTPKEMVILVTNILWQ
jgi:hypothetical protein